MVWWCGVILHIKYMYRVLILYSIVSQEVFGDSPRLSISGWFHTPEPPVGSDKASLKQIMSKGDISAPFMNIPATVFAECSEETEKEKTEAEELEDMKISQTDMNILKQYLNAEYLRPASMLKIRNTFIDDSSVQLYDFLNEEVAKLISDASFETDADEQLGGGNVPSRYTVGTGKRWTCIGPPHKHKYLRYEASTEQNGGENVGALISDIRQQLFRSPIFQRYLYKITNMQVKGYRDEIRRFRPGLDYTVAHHGKTEDIFFFDMSVYFPTLLTNHLHRNYNIISIMFDLIYFTLMFFVLS